MKTLKDFFSKVQREIRDYLDNFGKGNNRDIDPREKSTLITTSLMTEKRLKKQGLDWIKKDWNDWQKGSLFQSEIMQRWKDRFNITEEDFAEDVNSEPKRINEEYEYNTDGEIY